MRLICPNCDAQYEVDDGAVPPGGRDVQCSNCGHAWFQLPVDLMQDVEAEDEAPRPVKAPPPPPGPASSEPFPEHTAAKAPDAPAPATDPSSGLQRRTLDDNLLAVLREEAAREAAARRAEAARGIETQPDLGLQEAGRRPPEPPPPVVAPAPVADHPAIERPNARRDLLPDIEEINSTLRPGSDARDDDGLPPLIPAPRRTGFRTGFFSVLLAATVLVILYTMAPQLSVRFPGIAETMTSYVAAVDALRVWLDSLMQSAAGGLRGLTGED